MFSCFSDLFPKNLKNCFFNDENHLIVNFHLSRKAGHYRKTIQWRLLYFLWNRSTTQFYTDISASPLRSEIMPLSKFCFSNLHDFNQKTENKIQKGIFLDDIQIFIHSNWMPLSLYHKLSLSGQDIEILKWT